MESPEEEDKALDVTDEDSEKKSRAKQKAQREEELNDLKKILYTPEGVRFFKRFMDEGRMFASCMTGNAWTYHNEGKRDFMLRFWSDICEAAPEKIPELLLRGMDLRKLFGNSLK